MASTLNVATQADTWVLAGCDDSALRQCCVEDISPLLAAAYDEHIFRVRVVRSIPFLVADDGSELMSPDRE